MHQLFIDSLVYFLHLSHCLDLAQTEENAGQRLLNMEEQKKQRAMELENIEEQLRQYTAKSQIIDSELQYLLYVCLCY